MSMTPGYMNPWVRRSLQVWPRTGVLELRTSRSAMLLITAAQLVVLAMSLAISYLFACTGSTGFAVAMLVLGAAPAAAAVLTLRRVRHPERLRVTTTGIETDRYTLDWSEIRCVDTQWAGQRRLAVARVTPQAFSRATAALGWPGWYAKLNSAVAKDAVPLPQWLEQPMESVVEFLQGVHARQTGPAENRVTAGAGDR